MPDKAPETREYITPPSTQEAIKELLRSLFEGFKSLFQDTELGGFFDMMNGEVKEAQDAGADEKSIEEMITDPSFIERYNNASVGELFMQNQLTPGFFGMLFLKNERGFRRRHSFGEGEKFTCNFLGNKAAEKQIGLADIITDDDVAIITITDSSGKPSFGRRIIDRGKVYYAICDEKGMIPEGDKQYIAIHEGDTLQVVKRQAVSDEFKKYSSQYYQQKAVELRSVTDQKLRSQNPAAPDYVPSAEARDEKSARSLKAAEEVYGTRRAIEKARGSWGVACFRLAQATCLKLNGLNIVGGTQPKIDFKKGYNGKRWPDVSGTYAYDIAKSGQVPIGTAFHMSQSGDYQSMSGSNHWFTLTGFDKQGEPLFADQGGARQSIKQIFGVGRSLLAVYYA